MKKKILYADDDYESIGTLFTLRAPTLVIGLLMGVGISFVTSGFEEVLEKNVHVAFFLPFVIYFSAAIGTQTEAIYSRDLKSGHVRFSNYVKKEFLLGIVFGIVFSFLSGGIAYLWLRDSMLALSVGVAMCIAITTAPLLSLCVTQVMQSIGEDPAAGSGPIATVIQDMASIVIYGFVCSAFLL